MRFWAFSLSNVLSMAKTRYCHETRSLAMRGRRIAGWILPRPRRGRNRTRSLAMRGRRIAGASLRIAEESQALESLQLQTGGFTTWDLEDCRREPGLGVIATINIFFNCVSQTDIAEESQASESSSSFLETHSLEGLGGKKQPRRAGSVRSESPCGEPSLVGTAKPHWFPR